MDRGDLWDRLANASDARFVAELPLYGTLIAARFGIMHGVVGLGIRQSPRVAADQWVRAARLLFGQDELLARGDYAVIRHMLTKLEHGGGVFRHPFLLWAGAPLVLAYATLARHRDLQLADRELSRWRQLLQCGLMFMSRPVLLTLGAPPVVFARFMDPPRIVELFPPLTAIGATSWDYLRGLADKRHFETTMRQLGLPTMETVAELDRDAPRFRSSLPREPLFAKPRIGRQGVGATAVEPCGAGWRTHDGVEVGSDAALADLLLARARIAHEKEGIPEGVLVQRRLRPHRALRAVGVEALSTIRVSTLYDGERAVPLPIGFVRVGCSGAVVDNFSQGGSALLFHGAELRGRVRAVSDEVVAAVCERMAADHAQAQAMCVRAHEGYATKCLLAWDLAMTDDGLVMVEANPSPGVGAGVLDFLPGARYVDDPAIRAVLERVIEAEEAGAPA